jgi:hypothetical protein
VIRKGMLWLFAALFGALIAVQWPDIVRYVKIKQMSAGGGHPENVPASGTKRYPQDPADGEADGTGEFDAAKRGGPAAH